MVRGFLEVNVHLYSLERWEDFLEGIQGKRTINFISIFFQVFTILSRPNQTVLFRRIVKRSDFIISLNCFVEICGRLGRQHVP